MLSGSLLADNFYVVVRGSSGYENYRHEADAYHFVKMLMDAKVPRSQIIMMTFDDIAYNVENPKPGFIENRVNGTNVYLPDFKPDYSGEQVNSANFLSMLKNLPTTSQDNIFIYFTDHGSQNFICFPSDSDYLYNDVLMKTLVQMYKERKYAKMFFYLEACQSGSMFAGILPDNINIYAMTAATPDEDSWACCDDPTVEAYVGDEWSVNFLNDLNQGQLNSWTFNEQFEWTRRFTTTSTPCKYGNISMGDLPIGEFFGNSTGTKSMRAPKNKSRTRAREGLKSTWEIGNTKEEREAVDRLFSKIVQQFGLTEALQKVNDPSDDCNDYRFAHVDMERYKRLMKYYPTSRYLKHARVLALLCTQEFSHIPEMELIQALKVYSRPSRLLDH